MDSTAPAPTADEIPVPRLLTPRQVADLIGASERTVRRLAQDGVLERIRIGHRTSRYTARSVRALIEPPLQEQSPGDEGQGSAEHTSEAARHAHHSE